MTILNIVDYKCSTGTTRIEKAKYNTHGQAKYNMMNDDLHVPVTSAAL